jgi:GntR family transcriptional regulator
MLAIGKRDPVIRLRRVRSIGSRDCILEDIHLPARLFPRLELQDLPNNLYELYASEFGVTIGRASEKLKAVAAEEEDAEALGIAPGTPLLRIDRLAYSLDGRRAEWRVSLCHTDEIHYLSDLR